LQLFTQQENSEWLWFGDYTPQLTLNSYQ